MQVDTVVLCLVQAVAGRRRAGGAGRRRCAVAGCSVGLLKLVEELNVGLVEAVLVQEFVHVQVLELVAELFALKQVVLVPQVGAQECVAVDFRGVVTVLAHDLVHFH